MKLYDVLKHYSDIETIQFRCNIPPSKEAYPIENTMCFGYAAWKDKELISLDGDSYSLDEEIEYIQWYDGMLCVVEKVGWIGGE